MKLYLRDGKEKEIPIEKMQSLGEGDIIIHSAILINDEQTEDLERRLSNKLQRKVIILDGKYDGVLTIPPIESNMSNLIGTGAGD